MIYVFEGGSIVYDGDTITEEQKAQGVAVESLPEPQTPHDVSTAVIAANGLSFTQ